MYKFRDPSSNYVDQRNRTELQKEFVTLGGFIDIGPSLVTLAAVSIFGHKIGPRVKILTSMCVICAVTLFHIIFCKVNTDSFTKFFIFFFHTILTLFADKYFVPVCTFLLSDVSSLVGRILSGPHITKRNRFLALLINFVSVGLFGILQLFCRTSPKRNSPMLFPHDWEYMCILSCHQICFHFFIVSMILSIKNLVKPNQTEMGFLVITTLTEFLSKFVGFLAPVWISLL
nr:unnamed protein product [Callosobruchus chinensis]